MDGRIGDNLVARISMLFNLYDVAIYPVLHVLETVLGSALHPSLDATIRHGEKWLDLSSVTLARAVVCALANTPKWPHLCFA